MKKLMFATALGASVAAFGAGQAPELLSATSFEGYSSVAFVATNSLEQTDGGSDTNSFFTFVGESDSSVVKAFGGENAVVPACDRPKYYADSNVGQNFYLALDTEGGTLWRALALDSNNDPEAKAVAAGGTYLDTLVQFTVTEDEEPTVESGDKLAIWLQAGENETNLMVRAGYYDVNGTPVATNFVLRGTTVAPNEWRRLTVKAVANIIDAEGAYGSFYNIPAFIIYIDGTEMAAVEKPIADSLAELDGAIASEFVTLVSEKKVFPSLVLGSGTATLEGVGFKGTGAIDDLVWTEADPFEASAPAYPDYLETADSTIKGKYDDWKTAYSADTASAYENEFLVNANPATTTVTSNALEITEIKENTTDGGWDITIGCSVAGVDLTGTVGSTIVCNGYLAVSYTDDLAGTWTTENIAVTEVDATTGTVTVNVNKSGAKFMKVSLTVAPQPAANN